VHGAATPRLHLHMPLSMVLKSLVLLAQPRMSWSASQLSRWLCRHAKKEYSAPIIVLIPLCILPQTVFPPVYDLTCNSGSGKSCSWALLGSYVMSLAHCPYLMLGSCRFQFSTSYESYGSYPSGPCSEYIAG
jgi:hypothetical protein